MQEYAGQLVMAGGFIRACIANEHINDVDLFPASKELAQVMALKLAGGDLKGVYETENAYTVSRHLPMSVQHPSLDLCAAGRDSAEFRFYDRSGGDLVRSLSEGRKWQSR
jgi:hypothetical protein